MIQENLPNFDREYALAQEREIPRELTLKRLAAFYLRMDKCREKKRLALCQKQKQVIQKFFERGR